MRKRSGNQRLVRALIALLLGILIAAALNYFAPQLLNVRKQVFQSIRAALDAK